MKNILLVLLIALVGLVGHMDRQHELMLEKVKTEAATTCRFQTADTVPTYDQCIANQFEINNDK